jgi:hypothetical protein
VIHRPSAHAGERCHDNTIGQIQIAHADWGKERLDGHDGAPGQGSSGDDDFAGLLARLDEATGVNDL